MPTTDAVETSGTHNLRPRPTSPEDTIYIDTGRESLDPIHESININNCNLKEESCETDTISNKQGQVMLIPTYHFY